MMKIIDFGDFSFERYNVSNVSVIKQKNNWSVLTPLPGRLYNGFIVVTKGNCIYRWGDSEVTLFPGSVIYLPKGSRHTVTAPLKSLEFFRINFTITDMKDFNETVFSSSPILITHNAPQRINDICEELTNLTLHTYTDFKTMEVLCEFIAFCTSVINSLAKGIDFALKYIADHCMEEINLSELAEDCLMSYSHLFRAFKQRFGVTPIQYKNSLRLNKAKKLLCDCDLSVGEIAERLGFENSCYFTRAFKKYVGVSPLSYRRQSITKTNDDFECG